MALATFAWLLTLHPSGPGRTYAAYGGVYIVAALFWSWAVDHQTPTRWDVLGATICLAGVTFIVTGGPR